MRYYEPIQKTVHDVILDAQLAITATHGEGKISSDTKRLSLKNLNTLNRGA